MTKQEQINEMLLYVPQTIVAYDANPKGQHLYGEQRQQIAKALYDAGYRKTPNDVRELIDVLAEGANLKEKLDEIKRLEKENEQLKEKLEKNPLAIKQKIMEEDDYELTEREQATLFLDRMGSDVEILHDIVENLDELLGKGIDEYIMGIDGVEGLKDMWERSAVREFADKLKKVIHEKDYVQGYAEIGLIEEIDELLKEYE